jgi:hypothetical protein
MWGLPSPESLFNTKMALLLTIKNEEKVENLRKRNWGLEARGVTSSSKKLRTFL